MDEKMKALKKINTKSSKETMLTAIREAVKAFEERETATFNPVKIEETKKKAETIKSADKIAEVKTDCPDGPKNAIFFQPTFDRLISELTNIRDESHAKLIQSLENYNTLNDAIALKQSELNELFGIEKSMMNLAAIINAKDELLTKKELEVKEELSNLQKQVETEKENAKAFIEDLQMQRNLKISEINYEVDEYRKTLEKERKNEEKEYTYNRDWERKIDAKNWEEEVRVRTKEMEEKAEEKKKELNILQNVIIDRERILMEKEEYLRGLEVKVTDIPDLLADEKEKAIEETEARVKKSYTYEKTILENNYKSKIELLEVQNNDLRAKNTELQIKIEALEVKLDQAYTQIREVANKSIEGASNSAYNSKLEKILSDNLNSTTRQMK